MSVLTREEFLEEGALKTEVVTLDSGKEVLVSQIGGADYIKLWSDPKNQKETGEFNIETDGKRTPITVVDMSRFTPALLAYAIVNEDKTRMFADADIDLLSRLSSGPFLKVSEVARKLNGLSGEEAKNSESDQSDLPFSDSASHSDTDTPTI